MNKKSALKVLRLRKFPGSGPHIMIERASMLRDAVPVPVIPVGG